MDVDDMEIDLGGDIDVGLEEEAMNIEAQPPLNNSLQTNGSAQSDFPAPEALGNAVVADEQQQIAPEKIHIRGLDTLTTEDIRAFASEHFQAAAPVKIEWIDDTSANIVYESAEVASQALQSFSTDIVSDASAEAFGLRQAKLLTTHPMVTLRVRVALTTDVKKPHAREASRFYLLNPDKDPGLRRERQDHQRRRDGNFRSDRRSKRQRDEEEPEAFDVNMYDDDPESIAARQTFSQTSSRRGRRNSMSSFSSDDNSGRRGKRVRLRRGGGQRRDLFAAQLRGKDADGRLRGRSASPLRDGDGRLGFGEDSTNRVKAPRRRSRTPPLLRDMRAANGSSKTNAGRELFSNADTAGKELFPSRSTLLKSSSENGNRNSAGADLFARINRGATPVGPTSHHRKDAFDAADKTSDAAASELFPNRNSGGGVGGGHRSAQSGSRSLEDRITGGGPARGKQQNNINSGDTEMDDHDHAGGNKGTQSRGFNIRGSAVSRDGNGGGGSGGVQGFNIRGSATGDGGGGGGGGGKELFPGKLKSSSIPGEDLFSANMRERGIGGVDGNGPKRRQRAEDMFN